MEGRTIPVRSKSKQNISVGIVTILFVAIVLLGILFMQSHVLEKRLNSYNTKVAALQEEIEEEEARTEEIDELQEYMQTDEYAEEVARERLGFVKENEIVFEEASNQE